jgi:hypothetical protein
MKLGELRTTAVVRKPQSSPAHMRRTLFAMPDRSEFLGGGMED